MLCYALHAPAAGRADQRPGRERRPVCEAGAGRVRSDQSPRTGVTGDVVVGTDPTDAGRPVDDRRLHGAHQRSRRHRQDRPASTAAPARFAIKVEERPERRRDRPSSSATTSSAAAGMAGTRPVDHHPVADGHPGQGRPQRSSTGLATVTVNVDDAGRHRRPPKADSYRWLIGEDSPGFGGPIRDMWDPTCHGNAGKTTDTQYPLHGRQTNGGVHSQLGRAEPRLRPDRGRRHPTTGRPSLPSGYTKGTAPSTGAPSRSTRFRRPTSPITRMRSSSPARTSSASSSTALQVRAPTSTTRRLDPDDHGGRLRQVRRRLPPRSSSARSRCSATSSRCSTRTRPARCCDGKAPWRSTAFIEGDLRGNGIPSDWDSSQLAGRPTATVVSPALEFASDDAAAPATRAARQHWRGPTVRRPTRVSCNGAAGDFSSVDGLISPTIIGGCGRRPG